MEYLLESKRLLFRKLTDDDFNNLKAIISDRETMKYYPKPYDDNGVIRWINWCKDLYTKGYGLYALELKDTKEFIGDCGVSIQNIDGDIVYEIGYHINKKYWNNGYASEAAKTIKEWFFTNTDNDCVYSYMNSNNIASYTVAINNGMKLIKEYDEDGFKHKVYRITREEYLNEKSLLRTR